MNTTMTRTLGPVLAGLSLIGLAGCGGGYDRQEGIDTMVESGLTEEQATCVVDELEVSIGKDRLGERGVGSDDLSPEETQAVFDATTKCVLGG